MILTSENYFSSEANQAYMSVSQFKSFCKCEAAALAELHGEYGQPKTTALLVGSYVDAYFEGTLDIFKAQHPEIFTLKGELRADYKQAEVIIERIERDSMFMEYMSGEKQTIFTRELFGAQWKIKIDSLLPDKIVDLKCMRSIDRVMGKSFVEHWGYDLQMAIYSAVHGEGFETYLAVATKEPVTNLEIIHIHKWRIEECLTDVKRDLPHILEVKNGEIEPKRCGVCEYCRQTKVLKEPIDFELVGYNNAELNMILKGEI
ncbi:MAG: PD-(D/E)XK nuclease-like domain-containing protein [Solibacillus sp.]